jgi:energy-coupling factor transporter ATP-binding protein EcfA2
MGTLIQEGQSSFPKYKKERFLLALSEQEFLRKILRPILIGQGLKDVVDLNSAASQENEFPTFVAQDALGNLDVYALLLKRGALNPTRTAELQDITARVAVAIKAKLLNSEGHSKRPPTKILVCATGKISEKARSLLTKEGGDARILLWDANDIIQRIDEQISEFWLGVDTEIAPYFRQLKKSLEESSENLGMPDLLPSGTIPSAVTDQMFVPLRLFRTTVRLQTREGKVTRVPAIEQLPLTGIIRKPDRLVLIVGSAGSGKSTSLKRLAYIQAELSLGEGSQRKVPILLRAIDFFNDPASLEELGKRAVSKLLESGVHLIPDSAFAEGRVSVLVDSLDELPDDDARTAVTQKILAFHQAFPTCQVIVTSRPLPFIESSQILSEFSQYNLVSIDFKQAEKIVTRLQKKKSLPPAKSQEFLRRIQQVHGFELNPLLVTVFAATSEFDRKDIPANITELFKKYTELMLGRWDATKGMGQQYHAPLKDFLLRKVAFEMHRQRITSIPQADFAEFVKAELTSRGHKTDAKQLLDEMVHRSGLFRIVGDKIEFRHFLLQEFFAGRGIQSSAQLKDVVSDVWWQRATVFYFGENPGDSAGLLDLLSVLPQLAPDNIYSASVTLGLSLQASYLVEIKHKLNVLWSVIAGLSSSKDNFMASIKDGQA